MKTCYVIVFGDEVKPAIADVTAPGTFDTIPGCVVNRINVPHKHRGQGHGSTLLRQICEDADREGVSLHLCINPTGPLDYDQLEKWYRRYGFDDDPDENADGWFVRQPTNGKESR